MAHRSCAVDDPHHVVDDLFRARLENVLDLRHPLVCVTHVMPWEELIAAIGHALPAPSPGNPPEGVGCRPLSARLVIGLRI